MTTIVGFSAAFGALFGAWLGWKAGRGYERLRPARRKRGRDEPRST